jgi:O-antigen/teichoic acid export membrane protein
VVSPGLREQLGFALPSGLSNMVDVLNGEIDKLLAASFFTLDRFATYVNGAFEVPFFSTITGSISAVLIPQFVKHYHEGQREEFLSLWNESIARIAMLMAPLAVLLFLIAPDLVTLLFSDRYAESAAVFRVYLLVLIPKLAWYGAALVSMGLSRAPLYGSLLAIVCNLALNLVLIPRLGLIGPAVATVTTSHLLTAYYLWLFRRRLGASWSEVFPWQRVGKIAAVSLAAGLVALPVTRIDAPWSLLRMSLDALAFAAVLAFLYRSCNIISTADLEFLAGRLRKLQGAWVVIANARCRLRGTADR